ncbi:unnamed protein product [Symbiodinium sp. CCMP2592]|nr:unnamed protein product [Symbiodinium sp. CCMP2592]
MLPSVFGCSPGTHGGSFPFGCLAAAALPLATWLQLLPCRFTWPARSHRVEDGAGTCSTASPRPVSSDPLSSLRAAWTKRLLASGLAQRIAASLNSGSKSPPLSEAEVAPFLDDLRSFLHVEDDTIWKRLLLVQEGQPFRLNLWHCLSLVCADPDSGYFDLLRSGVPLGVPEPIPPCPVMHPPPSPDATVIPLQRCDSAWKSALDHADVVDELLEAELAEGWIALVRGGDAELRRRYNRTAVGKLGVVLAEGRPPRLVVDSSVSGVTSNTALPNRSANPTLSDVFFCMPLSDSSERLAALILDVAKAHRRILIRALDRGLLCFRHRGKLYQCLTLNFGARVSSFYWARAAGLLLRLVHRIVRVRHSAQIYVDDILALLHATSAPLWASLIVVLLLVLRVPMSWHKAALGPSVVWIGWEFNLSHFCVKLDPGKFTRLCALLRQALSSKRCSCHLLERVTGKLLWLSSLFRTFRPSLAPLYSDQHALLPTMTALQPERWPELLQALSPDLILLRPIGVAALPPGSKILRVNQTAVSCRGDLPLQAPDARRIWLQSSSPHTGMCVLSDSSQEVLRLWLDLCQSGTAVRSLLRPPLYVCEAFADACATELSAGLGGFVRLPDGRQLFFRQSFDRHELHSFFSWFPETASAQAFIASWELLAQCALVVLLDVLLGPGHLPVHCVFKCDNSAADAASWKGLSMAKGLCSVLRSFLLCQQARRISVYIDHVPGLSNDVADALRTLHLLGPVSAFSGSVPIPVCGGLFWFPMPGWLLLCLILILAGPTAVVKLPARGFHWFSSQRECGSTLHPALVLVRVLLPDQGHPSPDCFTPPDKKKPTPTPSTVPQILNAAEERHKAVLESKVKEGVGSITELAHPMVVTRADIFMDLSFEQIGELHEGARDRGILTYMDSKSSIQAHWKQEPNSRIVFLSYQWLSWNRHGPNATQFEDRFYVLHGLVGKKGLIGQNTFPGPT